MESTIKKEKHLFSFENFKELAEVSGNNCISIYIPTHKKGKDVKEGKDYILLKDQLKKVKNQLMELGKKEKEAEDYLQPVYNLLDDSEFWNYQSSGLAIFLSNNHFNYYRLPIDFNEIALVSDSYHLEPLMSLLNENENFYILTLSQKNLRLFECTKRDMEEVRMDHEHPTSLEDYFKSQGLDFEQFETHHPVGAEGTRFAYHGYDPSEEEKKYIKEFFQKADNAIRKILQNQHTPLVLAGVEFLQGIYKQVNHYKYLTEKTIRGNFDHDEHLNEMHKKALEIVEPIFEKTKNQEIDHFNQLIGTGQASYNLQEILNSAETGRIEALFIRREHNHKWGKYIRDKQEMELHNEHQPGDKCLLDIAGTDTLKNSGRVFFLEEMPDTAENSDIAALYRY